MDDMKGDKTIRILSIYSKLLNDQLVNKSEEANEFHVNERSIQRDIDDIRSYFDEERKEKGWSHSVVYDYYQKGYRLEKAHDVRLTNGEVLAICKILLASKAFTKEDMTNILHKLVYYCVPKSSQDMIDSLMKRELFYYEVPEQNIDLIDRLWVIGKAISTGSYLETEYRGYQSDEKIKEILKPLSIVFSEYFYLISFIEDEDSKKTFQGRDDQSLALYRIDCIESLRVLDEKFNVSHSDRFEENELRRKVEQMLAKKGGK